jgi:hypothetical protein
MRQQLFSDVPFRSGCAQRIANKWNKLSLSAVIADSNYGIGSFLPRFAKNLISLLVLLNCIYSLLWSQTLRRREHLGDLGIDGG